MAIVFCSNEGKLSIILVLFFHTHLFDQMVQAQQARNVKILGLVRAMKNTYSFAVSADELKRDPVLQDIIVEILKQTIECGYFIQGYIRSNFGGTWLLS